MKNKSLKSMLTEIAKNAVYDNINQNWRTVLDGRTYEFLCTPEELVATRKGLRLNTGEPGRGTEGSVKKRQEALLWLWQNLKEWKRLEAAYNKISSKVQELREVSAAVMKTRTYDERHKLLEREGELYKELSKFNELHPFCKDMTVEYLYQTMPANWIKMAS